MCKTKIDFFRNSISYLLSWTTSTWSLIIISSVLVVISHPVASVLIITVVLITLILNDSKKKVQLESQSEKGRDRDRDREREDRYKKR